MSEEDMLTLVNDKLSLGVTALIDVSVVGDASAYGIRKRTVGEDVMGWGRSLTLTIRVKTVCKLGPKFEVDAIIEIKVISFTKHVDHKGKFLA